MPGDELDDILDDVDYSELPGDIADDERTVREEMEPQPHGGALRRARSISPSRQVEAFPDDPSMMGWPATLALEIAMQDSSVKEICTAYDISQTRWHEIRQNQIFVTELLAARRALRQEGMAFKVRAGLQSIELLKVSWEMIHDIAIPPQVRADLLKFTVRASGNDFSKEQGVGNRGGVTSGGGNSFSININLR